MTIVHAIIICFIFGACVLCGLRGECTSVMPQLITLAGTAIGGCVGHAHGQHRTRKKKLAKKVKPKAPSAGQQG